jgi:hypothetical protein
MTTVSLGLWLEGRLCAVARGAGSRRGLSPLGMSQLQVDMR